MSTKDVSKFFGVFPKVLMMKTSKRIVRLQHGLQNSCDKGRHQSKIRPSFSATLENVNFFYNFYDLPFP